MSDESNSSKSWCFRSETVKLLTLSVVQIHTTMTEGDNSVDTLTRSFQELAKINLRASELAKEGHSEESMAELMYATASMEQTINDAIMAFQFYDRMCQRMSHVATGLHEIAELIGEEAKLFDDDLWMNVRDKIKNTYTMEAEHIMHEAIVNGATVEAALEIYKKSVEEDDDDGIELF